jgi:type III secretion system HrpE/YscL family protein
MSDESARTVIPLGRLIRATDIGFYNDAASALDMARRNADALVAAASSEATSLRDAAREAGLAEGRAEIATLMIDAAAEVRQTLAGLTEDIAAAIADGIAQIITGLDTRSAVAHAARLAVSQLIDRHGVTVRIAPSCVAATIKALRDHDWLTIEPDSDLSEDDCVIVTSSGTLQARLSRQVAALCSSLMASVAHREDLT